MRCWNVISKWPPTKDINTLRSKQNGRHFADDVFKCIFLIENVWISLQISLKFVPKGQINNIPPLVQIMAWRRSGDKPLFEPMMVSFLTHICFNELRQNTLYGLSMATSQYNNLSTETYILWRQIHIKLLNKWISSQDEFFQQYYNFSTSKQVTPVPDDETESITNVSTDCFATSDICSSPGDLETVTPLDHDEWYDWTHTHH